jgi:hypothetical protein
LKLIKKLEKREIKKKQNKTNKLKRLIFSPSKNLRKRSKNKKIRSKKRKNRKKRIRRRKKGRIRKKLLLTHRCYLKRRSKSIINIRKVKSHLSDERIIFI